MTLELVKNGVTTPFVVEDEAFSGVKKIAAKVCQDIESVTGILPQIYTEELLLDSRRELVVIAGTIGRSSLLESLEKEGKVDFKECRGKREVYQFALVDNPFSNIAKALVIAGSDKRGTVYGLFHISELIGVSAWCYWADVEPKQQKEIIWDEKIEMVSKEPSIKYRGFFINDEWPAFGNWTMEHFGGFTAQMYDKVFELLLRLKGNYLWPAMWTSSFSLDGPDLLNAQLADEYGIVMGNSHHEPCLRHSEEWDKVRGEDSVYGNEWNYYTNKEGLLRYWEDGLKRSGQFENVITIGMRGERDSSMLGEDATLKQNIDLLKDIITRQRELIHTYCGQGEKEPPQMLALYKEVEAYFYGDEQAEGLCDWDGLDGVTCMLCEDNFGNMRTLPTEKRKNRQGGWGMYYHFDYHGGPISYEWVNSTYLPKVWEQMTMAYEFGVRDIWIVNVGDLKFQELPLSFFMDLAYDFDTYGTKAVNQTANYTKAWVQKQFAVLEKAQQEQIEQIIHDYTKTNHNRKPEALSSHVYHPVHFKETERMLRLAAENEEKAEQLLEVIPEPVYAPFYEMIYYPAIASFNVLRMQLYAGINELYAKQGRVRANEYARLILECIEKDERLAMKFHSLLDGKWNGMALSHHVGFTNWNDEGCVYPVQHYVKPVKQPRMIVTAATQEDFSTGGDWSARTIYLNDFQHAGITEAELIIANGGRGKLHYEIACGEDCVAFSSRQGEVEVEESVKVSIVRDKLVKPITFLVHSEGGNVKVVIPIAKMPLHAEPMTFIPTGDFVAIEAAHYYQKQDTTKGQFLVLEDYGKMQNAWKAFPVTSFFTPGKDAPSISYRVWVPKAGDYELNVYSAPGNPLQKGNRLCFGLKMNEEEYQMIPTVSESYDAGTNGCLEWEMGVLNQIHISKQSVQLQEGNNTLTICAADPGFVLEKLVLVKTGVKLPYAYLGPEESYYFE